ncbi:hypothetical protein BC748_0756 [Flavobacterium dankookense]|uniref:Uncharacterized protein n=2 Tax=Flavobacterium dankookense TaxID=706186 RepID=A0A4R6QGP4_9FLAO|nr:hypothetical protein BC748_0756 [Flavobacterium dankookense]
MYKFNHEINIFLNKMDLKKNKQEYYYSNKIGSVIGNKVTIEKVSEEDILLNDISYVRLIFKQNVLFNVFFATVGIIVFIALYFIQDELIFTPIGLLFLLLFSCGALFYNKKEYFIQIVKTKATQVIVPVKKDDLNFANDLIKNIIKIKSSNTDFQTLL